MAEPRLLLIGKLQSTLDVLAEELCRLGRDVLATNDRTLVGQILAEGKADLVVIGGGLDEPARAEMRDYVLGLSPDIPLHLAPRGEGTSPATALSFANEQVVLYKVLAAAMRDQSEG
ncbi:hypothetical protein ABIC28_001916 [Rhodococcus sp. PvR044]|jgi:hypothetical protein|uniref:hypothetical protein n=1 Tax=Rhodococcus TaxID=1827 RepID=UPI000BD4DE47|nr:MULTISPECIES: hypothetical protein [Rhodococcus]MBP1161062.1 hypothetical protein [Rhodococcus sp. PvR099]MCZ4557524.1 hypothetical protein [Rhodococcus maanshanensis]PTR39456.1 hypothetical protein C8K38_11547 [Rhodococcus sp. OK611]SNX92607.1 hypothetical protein SAMN05447004_11547 [Rhodococcus sp. OK270]